EECLEEIVRRLHVLEPVDGLSDAFLVTLPFEERRMRADAGKARLEERQRWADRLRCGEILGIHRRATMTRRAIAQSIERIGDRASERLIRINRGEQLLK